jgi:REP element-mobilizing transposase RayT
MSKSRYKIVTEGAAPYFMTGTVVNWLPIFGNPAIAQIVLDSLRFLHEHRRLVLHTYVLMENHIHLIASSEQMSKEIGDFKSFTARTCIDWFQAHGKQWVLRQLKFHKAPHKADQEYQLRQEGYHPQVLQNEAMALDKLKYIHNNPVKRGYVDDPAHWRYSSYRNYMGLAAVLPIELLG